MLPKKMIVGNFIKSSFIGVLGAACASIVVLFMNYSTEPLYALTHFFWAIPVFIGVAFYSAINLAFSVSDRVREHRSNEAANKYSVIWGILFVGTSIFSVYEFRNYINSPLRIESPDIRLKKAHHRGTSCGKSSFASKNVNGDCISY